MRLQMNLSQGQVSTYAGISQSTLSDIENSKIMPKTLDALIALADYFKVSTDYLLGLTDDQVKPEPPSPSDPLLVGLPSDQRIVVRSLLKLLAKQAPTDRQFTLEVIQRLLLPVQPHIIGEDPDEPETDPESD